ncbi:MAG TPA: hypothetical protein VH044_00835 [Polyangiaceae bacterium]|nr:hypothetical protein [Polyangiaceae bacterium]
MANSLNRLVSPRLRAAALMPAAVLTVHQARFMLPKEVRPVARAAGG